MRAMRSAPTCSRPVASMAFAPAAQRRTMQKAMVHMAYSTPAQFSSFFGAKMLLPECYVRRAKLAIGMLKKPAQMSFLGVGAPEAILVAIVALVVFGPKGLADAAKSVGQTLRTFQPTIREVVEVSQDLKATLDKELGINELRQAAQAPAQRPSPLAAEPPLQPMSETTAKALDPDIEAKRAEAAKLAWGSSMAAGTEAADAVATAAMAGAGAAAAPAAAAPAAPAATVPSTLVSPAAEAKDLSTMSMADLEAELARRKAASSGKA